MITKMKKTKMKRAKTTKIVLVVLLILLAAAWVYLRQVFRQPTLGASELVKYDGSDENLPIYLVYEGYVYDVSSGGDDFYKPGEAYHFLVGKDSTQLLKIFGGDIIKRKYKVVGVYKP